MAEAMRALLIAAAVLGILPRVAADELVNDITQLNPIRVDHVVRPRSIAEIAAAIKGWTGPISIGGARHSQGGQTAEAGGLFLDMRDFNRVVAFDPAARRVTVETGITWRDLLDVIDPQGLSIAIMQTYANFTVGGSLSVNCHGRYIAAGPLIRSVESIKILLADGSLREADPTHNPEIFYGAIGGYGGLGVIVEATLRLAENTKVKRDDRLVPIGQYRNYFFTQVVNSPTAVFHNGDVYPPRFTMVRAVTWSATDRPLTEPMHMISRGGSYGFHQFMLGFISRSPWGKWFREYIGEPLMYLSHPVVWRNHEASYDVAELPGSTAQAAYVLQEYFVPVDRFDEFCPKMADILRRHHVNMMNISIRHASADPGSTLAWAKTEVFAFVMYYRQGSGAEDRQAVGVWTREMIEAAVDLGGSYYLPYQVWATPDQFHRAYPHSEEFFALKKRLDPGNRFRNQLWDAYDHP
jgi:FAD/FMN-containing dehydrogenase